MKTDKMVFLLLFCWCIVLPGQAQRTMSDVIRTMPDSILPLLTTNDRLDFVDYLESNALAKLKNRFGDECEMTQLTADYAHIRLSAVSEVAFKLLLSDAPSAPVICMVSTCVADSLADSSIRFFAADWTALPTARFLQLPATARYRQLILSAEATDLSVVSCMPRLLPEGETALPASSAGQEGEPSDVQPEARMVATYVWNRSGFRLLASSSESSASSPAFLR